MTLDFGIKQLKFSWNDYPGAKTYRLMEYRVGFGSKEVGIGILTTSKLNTDGSKTLTKILEIPIHKTDWINLNYLLEMCDVKCISSNIVETLNQDSKTIGYFKASNTGLLDFFGRSVAISDDGLTLAISADNESNSQTKIINNKNFPLPSTNNLSGGYGAVYIFTRNNIGNWVQQAYIKGHNTGLDDSFGYSISLSGDGKTLIVGSPFEDSGVPGVYNENGSPMPDNNTTIDAGAAYVFIRNSKNNWIQQTYIKASNASANHWFGYKVALSRDGQTIAVSAIGEDTDQTSIDNVGGISPTQASNNNAAPNAGAVYIFSRLVDNWMPEAYIKPINLDADDQFGYSIALNYNGKSLAASSRLEDNKFTGVKNTNFPTRATDNNTIVDSGAVYIFSRNSVRNWTQQAYIKASNTGTNDKFGFSVTLNDIGDTLAVSSVLEDSKQTNVINTNGFPTPTTDIATDTTSTADSGAVYVYTKNTAGNWLQQAYIKASNSGGGDYFGWSLALSGDGQSLVAGAIFEDSKQSGIKINNFPSPVTDNNNLTDSGAVYLYTQDSNSMWSQQSFIKASNAGLNDNFG
ncbi:MAG: FG-GAP repeat protein, partial [Candidatus Heimdallarchaeota archaeon]